MDQIEKGARAAQAEVLQVERSRIGLTLAIRDMPCTSFSYVLLRLIRFCFFSTCSTSAWAARAPFSI